MSMINPMAIKAVQEVLEGHGITPEPQERLSDVLARALGLSDAEAERWLEAITEGRSVGEACRLAGVPVRVERGGLLHEVARAMGNALGHLVHR